MAGLLGDPISTEGYAYFTIYRAHAVYHNPDAVKYKFAAGENGNITIFDKSFDKIRAQLDEITGASR
jgi:hypothetical protein